MKWILVLLLGCTTKTVYVPVEGPLQVKIKDCLPSRPPEEPELYCKGPDLDCAYKDIDVGKKLDHLRKLQTWVDITVKNCRYPASYTFSNYLNYSGGTR